MIPPEGPGREAEALGANQAFHVCVAAGSGRAYTRPLSAAACRKGGEAAAKKS